MDGTAGFFLITFALAGIFVPGVIFVKQGKNKNLHGLNIAGWSMVGAASIIATVLLVLLFILMGSSLFVYLIFIGPIVILAGIILTLSFSISFLAEGFSKSDGGSINKKKITIGFVLLGVNFLIVSTIIVLIYLFTTGVIPISLM